MTIQSGVAAELPFRSEGGAWISGTTGKWSDDNTRGRDYAGIAMRRAHDDSNPNLICSTVEGMIEKGHVSGVEIGFLSTVSISALKGYAGVSAARSSSVAAKGLKLAAATMAFLVGGELMDLHSATASAFNFAVNTMQKSVYYNTHDENEERVIFMPDGTAFHVSLERRKGDPFVVMHSTSVDKIDSGDVAGIVRRISGRVDQRIVESGLAAKVAPLAASGNLN